MNERERLIVEEYLNETYPDMKKKAREMYKIIAKNSEIMLKVFDADEHAEPVEEIIRWGMNPGRHTDDVEFEIW